MKKVTRKVTNARKTFGMQPTEWKQILKEVVAETRASDL